MKGTLFETIDATVRISKMGGVPFIVGPDLREIRWIGRCRHTADLLSFRSIQFFFESESRPAVNRLLASP